MSKLFDSLKIKKDALLALAKRDYLGAARLYRSAGDHEQALKCYFDGQHYLEAAEIYLERGEFARAADMYANEAEFAKAGELAAKAAAAAPDAQKKGLWAKAAIFYEKANQPALAADMHDKAGNLQKAVAHYESAQNFEKAAMLHAKLGDRARAGMLLEQALAQISGKSDLPDEMDPNAARKRKLWKALSDLYGSTGQAARAAPFLLKLGIKDKAAEGFFAGGDKRRAAEIWVDLGNFEAAARALAAESDPALAPLQARVAEHFGAHLDAAKLFEKAGDKAGAARNYEKGGDRARAALLASEAGDYLKAGKLFAEAGEHGKAAEMFFQEGETAHAAEMYERAGQLEKAAELFLKVEHTERAADILLRGGKRAEALALLQKVAPSSARYPEACALLGRIFREDGEFALAAERLSIALKGQKPAPDNAEQFYDWADALERAGQRDEAKSVFEKLQAAVYGHRDVRARLAALAVPAAPGAAPAAAAAPPPAPAARYRAESKLWSEPLFEVWEGQDTQLNRRVRLYRIAGDAALMQRLGGAAQAALKLHHPNVEPVLDIVPGAGELLVVAEAAPGESLAARLARGPVGAGEAVESARAILAALSAAHSQNLLHGGLCPERVWLGADGAVRVGGFGFISRAEESLAKRPVTSHYITPEQFTGDKLDSRADIYLFGLLFKAMLVGPPPASAAALPWEHTVSEEADPDLARLPAELADCITRCLRRRREERYASATAVRQALDQVGLLPGTVISSRYEVVRRIGAGGMGAIYQVRDRELDEQIALKVLLESAADEETRTRFLRELKIARRITHPYVVRVFDLDRIGDKLFLTMEFVEGVPLTDFVARGFCADVRRPLDLAWKIAQGMEAAHAQGVVHRDLKPLNILIDRQGNPKILDFGIAKTGGEALTTAQTELTRAGQIFGSPKWMSPEQCEGKPADGRSDIYSYGAILYYMFTGDEPFAGDSVQQLINQHLNMTPPDPRARNPQVPQLAAQVILACLRKDKAQRPGSFAEIVAVLGPLRQQALATVSAPAAG